MHTSITTVAARVSGERAAPAAEMSLRPSATRSEGRSAFSPLKKSQTKEVWYLPYQASGDERPVRREAGAGRASAGGIAAGRVAPDEEQ